MTDAKFHLIVKSEADVNIHTKEIPLTSEYCLVGF